VLDWEGCFNVRDLGGLPTVDGRETRYRALVRADNLVRLTDEGCRAARAFGMSAVIDLRSSDELAEGDPVIRRLPGGPRLDTAGPHPFCALDGVVYQQMRLRDFPDEEFAERVRGLTSQEQVYRMSLRGGATAFARIARAVVAAPPGAVVIHCNVGKDRTGLLVGVLLSAVGVTDDAVAADYGLSEGCLRPMREFRQTLATPVRQFTADEHLSPPDLMVCLLAELHEAHSGAAGYLRSGGLGEDELERLRRRLVG
jgi:protein-tyrosine phosphatase